MATWCIMLVLALAVMHTSSAARNVPNDSGLNDQKNFVAYGGVGGLAGAGGGVSGSGAFGGIGGGVGAIGGVTSGLGDAAGLGGGGIGGIGGGVGGGIGGGSVGGIGGGSGNYTVVLVVYLALDLIYFFGFVFS